MDMNKKEIRTLIKRIFIVLIIAGSVWLVVTRSANIYSEDSDNKILRRFHNCFNSDLTESIMSASKEDNFNIKCQVNRHIQRTQSEIIPLYAFFLPFICLIDDGLYSCMGNNEASNKEIQK